MFVLIFGKWNNPTMLISVHTVGNMHNSDAYIAVVTLRLQSLRALSICQEEVCGGILYHVAIKAKHAVIIRNYLRRCFSWVEDLDLDQAIYPAYQKTIYPSVPHPLS